MDELYLSAGIRVVFIAAGLDADKFKIFDATHVDNILAIKQITGMETYDVIANNNDAIVIASDGLYQYDYSNINNIKLLSKISIAK